VGKVIFDGRKIYLVIWTDIRVTTGVLDNRSHLHQYKSKPARMFTVSNTLFQIFIIIVIIWLRVCGWNEEKC